MITRFLPAFAAAVAACIATASAAEPRERNFWPFWVQEPTDELGVQRWTSLGPLAFGSAHPNGDQLVGLRPLFHQLETTEGSSAHSFVYPLWYREFDAPSDDTRWTVFNLINSRSGPTQDDRFSIWPIYFSRQTGEPETSYRAVFPLYGDIAQRFGQNRLQWFLFPLFVRYENDGATTTGTPWPFLRTVSGENHHGFALWPLAGYEQETGVSSSQFAVWPLFYRVDDQLDTAAPRHRVGLLPFYARETAADYRSETFGWPFFGYSERTAPIAYQQTNYFWPLWVQGRGEERHVNRWAPFYAHSDTPARQQTWILWPLWRDRQWTSEHLDHHRRQLLYFLYHHEVQSSRQSPDLPAAHKRHLWPLFSTWNDGAGRAQIQALSPLEVFFPHNERMRQLWSPWFALYRFDQQAPGEVRHSLLWNALTYARSADRDSREFHLGPLFDYTSDPSGTRWGFLGGLLRVHTQPTGGLRASSLLFPASR